MTGRDREAIEQRLRAALTLDAAAAREGVDMSASAITHRLMELAEMSSLCLELAAVGAAHDRLRGQS